MNIKSVTLVNGGVPEISTGSLLRLGFGYAHADTEKQKEMYLTAAKEVADRLGHSAHPYDSFYAGQRIRTIGEAEAEDGVLSSRQAA